MSVNIGSGACAIPGTEAVTQGTYFVYNDGTVNKTISASSPTQPRKDAIIAQVLDSEYSGASNLWQLAVITGTPSGSPVLPTLPVNSFLLAEVNVLAAATQITTANITNRQVYANGLGGVLPCSSTTRPSLSLTPRGQTIWEIDTGKMLANSGSFWGLIMVDKDNDTGVWASYTPTFGGTLGTGSIVGRYKLLGKSCFFDVVLTFGGTSTMVATFTLPFNRRVSGGDGETHTGHAFDVSANQYYGLLGRPTGLATVTVITQGSPAGNVNTTSPFTWGSTDTLKMAGHYEIA
jgi:hypothetical protein